MIHLVILAVFAESSFLKKKGFIWIIGLLQSLQSLPLPFLVQRRHPSPSIGEASPTTPWGMPWPRHGSAGNGHCYHRKLPDAYGWSYGQVDTFFKKLKWKSVDADFGASSTWNPMVIPVAFLRFHRRRYPSHRQRNRAVAVSRSSLVTVPLAQNCTSYGPLLFLVDIFMPMMIAEMICMHNYVHIFLLNTFQGLNQDQHHINWCLASEVSSWRLNHRHSHVHKRHQSLASAAVSLESG